MKEYITPRMQLLLLNDNDILTASPEPSETETEEKDLWTPWV